MWRNIWQQVRLKWQSGKTCSWRESESQVGGRVFFFPPQLVRAVGRQEERVRRGGGEKKTPKSIHCHGGAAHGAKTLVCDANTDASTLLLRKMWPARKTKTTTTKKRRSKKKSPRGSVRGGKISSEQKQKSPPRPARCSQSSGRKRSSVPKGWISVRRLPGKQGVESHGSLDRGCLTVCAGNN